MISRCSLRLAQWVLLGCGVVALGYTGFVYLDAWSFQSRQNRELELHVSNSENLSATISPLFPPSNGDVIGRLEIARLNLSVIVAEGVGAVTLRRAAGHIPGTAFPGRSGNVGISAHRDTYFRSLRNIRRDDEILILTPHGVFRYRVTSTKIVPPTEVSVLNASDVEVLTLVTCYPFYFVGPAPSRFIVRAERFVP